MSKETSGTCVYCGRILADDVTYADTICSECYLTELEDERYSEYLGELEKEKQNG
jgi:hypothetical protein